MADPVAVTVVDTGGHGDKTLPDGVIAQTPGTLPNIAVTVIGPTRAIFIRFVNVYLTTLVGLIGAGQVTNIIPVMDFATLVINCAQLSFAAAVIDLFKNLITIFGKLESKYPLLTGSV